MKNDKIVEAYNAIVPDADAMNRVYVKVKQASKKNKKQQFYKSAVAFAAVAAVILFAVFGTNLLQNNDMDSPFVMRVYAMELQADGTYVWREIDITQLYGWGEHYDGEVLHIGLGLWFEFEGDIRNVEFTLEDGFFATQYIGNRGDVPNVTSWHISTPPDYTTSRLVVYGDDFDKIGSTITFGNALPNDILLFWGSNEMSIKDWWNSNRVIVIDVTVVFEDGEIHNQRLELDFSDGWGVGWIDLDLLPDLE